MTPPFFFVIIVYMKKPWQVTCITLGIILIAGLAVYIVGNSLSRESHKSAAPGANFAGSIEKVIVSEGLVVELRLPEGYRVCKSEKANKFMIRSEDCMSNDVPEIFVTIREADDFTPEDRLHQEYGPYLAIEPSAGQVGFMKGSYEAIGAYSEVFDAMLIVLRDKDDRSASFKIDYWSGGAAAVYPEYQSEMKDIVNSLRFIPT